MFAEPQPGPGGPAPLAVVATAGADPSISEPMRLDRLLRSPGGLAPDRVKGPGPLGQIASGRQGANRSPWRATPRASGLPALLPELEHGGVLAAPGDLRPEDRVPDRVALTV